MALCGRYPEVGPPDVGGRLGERYTGQLSLFDLKGFTDSARACRLRRESSGKAWVGAEEVNAAADALKRMVADLQEEIVELDSEYRRLLRAPEGRSGPADEREACTEGVG